MTKYEIMVIVAAAAAFVLINIIMWSIIIFVEKRAREKNGSAAAPIARTAPAEDMQMYELPPDNVSQRPRVKRSDFILLDDIVIVHTDERIN